MSSSNTLIDVRPAQDLDFQPTGSIQKQEAGLAPLLLTVVELIRQLMEAQVIRRMDASELSDADLDRAADALRTLEEQVINFAKFLTLSLLT